MGGRARLLTFVVATFVPGHALAAGLLDVPFVSQSERLCGGAAAAMVLRYWGTRGVVAEDFAPLVDPEAGGIRQTALVGDLRARGWTVLPLDASDADAVTRQLGLGRPVLALIEDRPGRYHYIVVVGATADHVVYHDPALAPFRAVARQIFARAWSATRNWAVVILPAESSASAGRETESTAPAGTTASGQCGGLVAEGVRLAGAGDREGAAQALEASVALCPESADAHLELAGLRFVNRQWKEAEALAARAAALSPESAHAWRVIASSRFVEGDRPGALDAWNRVGEPRLDLIRVSGLVRTRHRVVEEVAGVDAGTLMTNALLARTARRVAALPALSASRVDYAPASGGLADLDIAVLERPLRPSPLTIAARAARAAVDREIVADASSLTRGGERVTVGWRFWENRPAVGVRVETPSLFGAVGLWTIEGVWSRQPYSVADGAVVVSERRHAGVRYANWLTGSTRVEAGAGVDRWSGRSMAAFLSGAVEQRMLGDNVSARAAASIWPARAAAYGAASAGLAWRARATQPTSFRARAGVDGATAAAPLDLWPGAGTGHARAPRLRAHPLLEDGVVAGAVFGQRLAHASGEARRALLSRGLLRLDGVVFADAARAWRAPLGDRRTHVDVGAGVRLRGPGTSGGIAVDIARGLRDGRMAVSAGWEAPWPAW